MISKDYTNRVTQLMMNYTRTSNSSTNISTNNRDARSSTDKISQECNSVSGYFWPNWLRMNAGQRDKIEI